MAGSYIYSLTSEHPVLDGQRPQTAGVALAHGAKLPFSMVAVNFAENHRDFCETVFRQVDTGNFGVRIQIHQADEGAMHHAEVLAPDVRFMGSDRHHQVLDVKGTLSS